MPTASCRRNAEAMEQAASRKKGLPSLNKLIGGNGSEMTFAESPLKILKTQSPKGIKQ